MNINIQILKHMLNRENYNSSFSDIDIHKEDKDIKDMFYAVKDMMEIFKEQDLFTIDEFSLYCQSKWPQDSIKEALLASMASTDISTTVLKEIVSQSVLRSLAYNIALTAIDVSEGKEDFSKLLEQIKKQEEVETTEEIKYVSTDLEELYEHNVSKQGLRWRLQTLNEMLGSLRKGDFGFIFARPESGKTTFLASEVSYFATQCSNTILWFNNEEQGEKVQLRVFQAALGYSLDQLFSNKAGNKTKYDELTHDNVRIIDRANIYKRDVEKIVKQVKPALIIFDQIDKIKGFDNDREDLRLGSIYIWARELAKEFCPVIGVCQADGTGEGKQRLDMSNVANAKTSKQAEADWILGIGKRNDPGYEYIRTLHLSKNKLTGDTDTVAELRHGTRDVIIKPEIARYADIQ